MRRGCGSPWGWCPEHLPGGAHAIGVPPRRSWSPFESVLGLLHRRPETPGRRFPNQPLTTLPPTAEHRPSGRWHSQYAPRRLAGMPLALIKRQWCPAVGGSNVPWAARDPLGPPPGPRRM
jgi:hypothetical protein